MYSHQFYYKQTNLATLQGLFYHQLSIQIAVIVDA